MTASLLPPAALQFADANGLPYSGGKLSFFVPGTDTAKTVWSDPEQTTPLTQPVVLDAAGRCIVYGNGDYRCIFKDSLGNLIFDQLTAAALDDTSISSAMLPVTSANSLATAISLMGVASVTQLESIFGTANTWTATNTYTKGVISTGFDDGGANVRLVGGNYGFMLRNDGANSYLLLTNSGSQTGSFNTLRPLAINNATGVLTLDATGAGASFNGGLTVAGSAHMTDVEVSTGTIGGVVFPGSGIVTIPGIATAPTAAKFTRTTQLATTQFCMQAVGNYNLAIGITASTTFTPTQAGAVIYIYTSSAITVTFPNPALCGAGVFRIVNAANNTSLTYASVAGNVLWYSDSTGTGVYTWNANNYLSVQAGADFVNDGSNWYGFVLMGAGYFNNGTGTGSGGGGGSDGGGDGSGGDSG